jgi:hypothetical protein
MIVFRATLAAKNVANECEPRGALFDLLCVSVDLLLRWRFAIVLLLVARDIGSLEFIRMQFTSAFAIRRVELSNVSCVLEYVA